MKKYVGVLDGWFETGTEGTVWVLLEDGKDQSSYEAMQFLKPGDHLKVYGEDGAVVFNGIIDPDTQVGLTPSPFNPEYKQPSALGYWIHWTQRGWQPDDWARLFMRADFGQTPFRAELTKF